MVSKAALGAALFMALLVPPSPEPIPQTIVAPTPAALATAEPPRLTAFTSASLTQRLRPATGCASVRRELRFEIISDESQEQHPRRPAVCLAVYHPDGG